MHRRRRHGGSPFRQPLWMVVPSLARGTTHEGDMRVLLASDDYPPYIGGAQIQTHLLATQLKARGHDVAVATVWQDDLPSYEDGDGVRLHRLRQLRTLPFVTRRQRRH